jgi:hypothetical protein
MQKIINIGNAFDLEWCIYFYVHKILQDVLSYINSHRICLTILKFIINERTLSFTKNKVFTLLLMIYFKLEFIFARWSNNPVGWIVQSYATGIYWMEITVDLLLQNRFFSSKMSRFYDYVNILCCMLHYKMLLPASEYIYLKLNYKGN